MRARASLGRRSLQAVRGGSFPAVPVQGGKVLDEAVEVAESGERRREEAAEVGAVLGIGVFDGLLDEAPCQRGIDLGQCGSAAAGDDLGGDVRVTSLPVLRNTVRVPGARRRSSSGACRLYSWTLQLPCKRARLGVGRAWES